MARTVERELCDFFANEYWRAAVQEDDPQQCMTFLKLAQQWLAAGKAHGEAFTAMDAAENRRNKNLQPA